MTHYSSHPASINDLTREYNLKVHGVQYRVVSSYMEDAIDSFGSVIYNAKLSMKHVEYDTIIGTGLSGALVVPRLAEHLDVNWAVVRKDNDGSHSWSKIEGAIGERWVFVDDFIETGDTISRVVRTVTKELHKAGCASEFVGAYLYQETRNFQSAYYLEDVEYIRSEDFDVSTCDL